MNPTTENDPLMDMVAKLDPSPTYLPPVAITRKRELFDQLTDPQDVLAPVVPREEVVDAGRSATRRRLAVPAIAAALFIVVAAFVFTLSRSPSAEAVLVAAAQQSALIESGRAEIVLDLRSLPGETIGEEIPSIRLDFVFDGDDYRLDTLYDGVIGLSEMRVDDVSYFGNSLGLGSGLVWSVETGSRFPANYLGSVAAADAGPESVLALVELADDFERTETDRGATYHGTISRVALLAQQELPAGVAIATNGADPASELPETLDLEVEVIDGLVHNIKLLVEGDLPTGEFVSATLTTTYFESGQPQDLQAPAAEDLVSRDEMFTGPPFANSTSPDPDTVVALPQGSPVPLWVPGPEAQSAGDGVLAKVLQRRPGLCFEAGASPRPPVPGEELAFYDEMKTAVINCFELAGEPEAADAIRDIAFG